MQEPPEDPPAPSVRDVPPRLQQGTARQMQTSPCSEDPAAAPTQRGPTKAQLPTVIFLAQGHAYRLAVYMRARSFNVL